MFGSIRVCIQVYTIRYDFVFVILLFKRIHYSILQHFIIVFVMEIWLKRTFLMQLYLDKMSYKTRFLGKNGPKFKFA